MFSGEAVAKVALKKRSLGGLSCSAVNQLPLATRTPFSMHKLKISSSISGMLRFPASGWSL